MHARDQSSIFSTGGKFRSDYGLLLELHTLTLVTCSYALTLSYPIVTLLLSVITAMKYWAYGGHHRQVSLYCEMKESGRGTIMYSLKTTQVWR